MQQTSKVSSQKVTEFLQMLVKFYKDRQILRISSELNNFLLNKSSDLSYHFTQINVEQQQRTLKQLHDGIWYSNLTQEQRDYYNNYTEFLNSLIAYYVEREKFGSDIVNKFKHFFIGAGNLISEEQTRPLFRFATKQILKEFSRVVKSFKKRAKDEQSLKQATQVEKQLSAESISIMSDLMRSVNTKGAQELKLLVSNQQMKIHFILYQFDRAAACDKPEKEPQLLDISAQCDLITYNYYRGRISVFSSNFREASQCLQRVLEQCPRTSKGLKVCKQVLKHLIPINMFMGKFPTPQMIEYFKLPEYIPLCNAVRQGNIKLLQEVIDKYRGIWIKRSLLIILDQLKVLAYRNLCKKVWLITGKQNKLKLEIFVAAFKFTHPVSQPPSVQEVCCIISNLIYLKFIQGKLYQDKVKGILAVTLASEPFKMMKDLK